jgi:CubicO group peptidase (beta-lactamase class C family)
MVLRDGECVREQYWAPYVAADRPLVYSASKTFSATAVGLAIGEGFFGLDDRVVELLGSATADDRVAQLTVHHLLSMSTGHTEDTMAALESVPPSEWVDRFLSLRPQDPVGSRHVYNNGASFLLGELVRRHTGTDLLDFLRPRLLEPLGIDATWDTDALGRCLGWTGLHIDLRGLAAMGELLRRDGVWHGRRLLPEGWVARATSKQIPTQPDEPAGREWTLGYGYQVWMGREGYRLDGAFGQFSFVIPERGLVVAVQSAQSCTQILVDLLWEHLDEFGSDAADPEERAQRVGSGSLPIPPDSGLGAEWASTGALPVDLSLMDPGEEVGRAPDLADVRVKRDGDGFRLFAVAEESPVELATTPGEWRRQWLHLGEADVPVALAAGADDAGDLHARLVFTDTPHTLRLRLRVDGSAGLAWKVNPLQGPWLAGMRAR